MPPGTVISGKTLSPVPKQALLDQCLKARVIYLGETHTQKAHHDGQLEIIQFLAQKMPGLTVGMEMFDQTYQPVLDLWTRGQLTEAAFLEKTHWYANWRFDFKLYREILTFIKDNQIPVYGLNLPFHIPAKVAVGGLDSLLPPDAGFVPDKVDLTIAAHKAYVKSIFNRHPPMAGRDNFAYFHQAQCLWEDAMAASVADHLGSGPMVVLVGKGHIIQKFGIPDRAFARTTAPFVTVIFALQGEKAHKNDADFIWITEKTVRPRPFGKMKMKKKMP